MDAARRENRLGVADFGLVAVQVFDGVVVSEHVLDIQSFEISSPALVDPNIRDVGGGNGIAEPFMAALVDDDEIELQTDAGAGPVPLQITVGETITVGYGALMLHA